MSAEEVRALRARRRWVEALELAFERGRDVEGRELLARARGLAVESGAAAFLRRDEAAAAEHGA